ncbi:MAG: NosD domain-containing protein [Candidatus Bathyarchaeia archaeon]|jgi:parallel beta-helix repeat protein
MPKPALTLTLILLFVFALCFAVFEPATAQSNAAIAINPDGSVTGTSSIQHEADLYALNGNISGGISIQRSNIVLDGAGFAIVGNGEGWGVDLSNGRGQDPTRTQINNVTVANLTISNFYYGINSANTNDNTLSHNTIKNCENGIWIIGSLNNTISSNNLEKAGIAINYAGTSSVTNNDFLNCSIQVWLSNSPLLDMNYWSDYSTRYPQAKEIGDSGTWDTPYVVNEDCQDNHPRTAPLNNAEFPDNPAQTDTTQNQPPIDPYYVVLPAVASALVVAALLIVKKTRRGGSVA